MKTALLIVDVQNCFINKWTQHVPKNIVKLLENESFAKVIFSRFVNTPNSNFVRQFNYTKGLKSPYNKIVKDLEPWIKKDNVFVKSAYSIFTNPAFNLYLKSNKIEELIIVGLDTDYCVLADCFNGFDAGYAIKVIVDCCASSSSGPAGHLAALEIIKNNIGKVI